MVLKSNGAISLQKTSFTRLRLKMSSLVSASSCSIMSSLSSADRLIKFVMALKGDLVENEWFRFRGLRTSKTRSQQAQLNELTIHR